MANRAYLSVWSRGFAEANMLEQLAQFLKTVPFSTERPGFTQLVIRAVDPTQTTLVESDLRSGLLDVADLVRLAREHLHFDSAYEIQTHWDLWVYDANSAGWQRRPQRLEIVCHGKDYDDGAYVEAGHFRAEIGFEHLFTGHAGLLNTRANGPRLPHHPAEAEFLALMARPENLHEYHQKTRENIQKLTDWVQEIEQALPLERYGLWSEGEENFEARLDEILAVG